jgi:hypothetical protein
MRRPRTQSPLQAQRINCNVSHGLEPVAIHNRVYEAHESCSLAGLGGECSRERGFDGNGAVPLVGQARDCFWLAVELVPDDFSEHGIISLVQLGLVVSL